MTAPELRESFRDFLQNLGVGSGVHYPKLTVEQPALAKERLFEIATELTQSMRLSRSETSIPVHPFLTDLEVQQVIDACNRWQP